MNKMQLSYKLRRTRKRIRQMRRQDLIESLAIVGEKRLGKSTATIRKPFTISTIKRFNAGVEQAARDRLSSAN